MRRGIPPSIGSLLSGSELLTKPPSDGEDINSVSHADVAPILRPDVRPVSARRRLLSIAALVLLPVGVVFIIIGLVRGMPELLYGLGAFLIACWAGWRALGHLGRRRW